MTTAARRRILKDIKKMSEVTEDQGILAAPSTDILHWEATIFGPEDTPWEGGVFQITIEFTEEYPNKPPELIFTTKMFHPNIYNDGKICLDILQKQWSSMYDVSSVLTSLRSLLSDPNPESPANNEAAKLFTSNIQEYNKRVKQIVENSWKTKHSLD